MIAILFLILAVGAYSISQLQQHNKLRWQDEENNYFSFWGRNSWVRKYAGDHQGAARLKRVDNPNWYYKLIQSKYRERWFTSTNLTVAFTDGYHASQSVSFLCLALSLSLFSGYSFFWFWPTIPLIHAVFYRVFQK